MRTGEDYTVLKSDYRDAWEGTSRILGIPESETLSRAVELATELPDALAEAIEELPPELGASPYVDKLYEEITKRARHCMHLELMNAPSREGDFA